MSANINLEHRDIEQLQSLVRKCVHCGFCNASCPSYQELGNELDGPRGRIYQISSMLNEQSDSASIRQHLDSCLNCRNCETACPSGVEYGKIFSLGKQLAVKKYPYSNRIKIMQSVLVRTMGNPGFCRILFAFASWFRLVLPSSIKRWIPKREKILPLITSAKNSKKVLLIQGCIQSGASPNTNRALHNLCARLGLELISIKPASCCGALDHHLSHEQRAMKKAQTNIDACQSYIELGIEAIVMSASACVLEMREYPSLLRYDHDYTTKAKQFADLVQDPSQLLAKHGLQQLELDAEQSSLAFHPPCTLQHGQKNDALAESLLQQAGFQLQPIEKKHLCCGSAGTYSLFQPRVAKALQAEKIAMMTTDKPEYLATANIGCQMFLQQVTHQKLWHWLELLENLANSKNKLY